MTKSLTLTYTPLELVDHLVFPGTVPGDEPPRIFLPIIQRESVWQPTQVCEFWDSLLRGIPLPSLILSDFHDSDASSIKQDDAGRNDENSNWQPSKDDYLLLDGQQRARALLGGLERNRDTNGLLQRLWLDLHWPHKPDSNANDSQGSLDEHGLRFGFFLCTQASPWGHDRARSGRPARSYIATARKALYQSCWYPGFSKGGTESGCYDFEIPLDYTWPVDARCPVPFKSILDYLKWHPEATPAEWKEFLKKKIERTKTKIISEAIGGDKSALQFFKPVPDDILERIAKQLSDKLPLLNTKTINAVVANLDHEDLLPAFKRINRNGSDVKNEELFFAAIKQEEPSCDIFARLAGTRLPPLDVVRGAVILTTQPSQGASASSSKSHPDKRTPPIDLSPDTLRKLEKDVDGEEGLARKLSEELKQESNFTRSFKVLTEDLLKLDPQYTNDKGLPSVMLPRLAVTSWLPPLAWLISRPSQSLPISPQERERILQYVLTNHFFADWSPDKERAKMLRDLIDFVTEEASNNNPFPKVCEIRDRLSVYVKSPITSSPAWLRDVDDLSLPQRRLVLPLTPTEWESFLKLFIRQYNGSLPDPSNYGGALPGLSEDILMWSQREAMEQWFKDHSNKISQFSKVDQPWDIDHIVPWSFFYKDSTQRNGQGGFAGLLNVRFANQIPIPADRSWANIKNIANRFGNKRLWPSGFNRQDGASAAGDKLSGSWLSGLEGWKVLSNWASTASKTSNSIISASRISIGRISKWNSTRQQSGAWDTASVSEFLAAVIDEKEGREIDIYSELFDFLESGLTCHKDWENGASGDRFRSVAATGPD